MTLTLNLYPFNRRNHLHRHAASPIRAIQVQPSEIESCGDYGSELADELKAASQYEIKTASPSLEIAADQFEAIYHWFLS